MKLNFSLFIYLLLFTYSSNAVCDLELLILELKQDLDDNGLLDCLREIPAPLGYNETSIERNKRLSAQWDTSCSFESNVDWFSDLKRNYGVSTLVNVLGEPVEHNHPDQADMCEIIRAVIAAGVFPQGSDVTNIRPDIFNYIDCPGNENGVKICAVNSVSFYKKEMWTIFLTSSAISINNKPLFIIDNEDEYSIQLQQNTNHNNKLLRNNIHHNDITSNRYLDTLMNIKLFISNPLLETTIPNQNWLYFKSTTIHVQHDTPFYLFTYTMVSPFKTNSRLLIQLTINNTPYTPSRMITGYQATPTITTSLITKLPAGSYTIKTQYKTNSQLHISPHSQPTSNIISTAFLLPHNNLLLLQSFNNNSITLFNDNNWTLFPNVNINNIVFHKDTSCLIIYSLSLAGMNNHIVTHIDINAKEVKQSRAIAGDTMYWGIHNGFVFKFVKDVTYDITMKYRTAFSAMTNPSESEFEQQGVVLLELPEGVEVVQVDGDEEVEMKCDDEWNAFHKMKVYIEVDRDVNVVVMYNVVVPLVNKVMTVGVFVNDRFDKKSGITYGGVMYYKGMGYVGVKLSKGRNKIEMKYKTQACVTYKPDSDWQNVSMTIVKLS